MSAKAISHVRIGRWLSSRIVFMVAENAQYWPEVLTVRDAHLHLYGKSPRPGRKLGHVTLRGGSPEQLASRLGELPGFFHRPEFCLDAVLAPVRA